VEEITIAMRASESAMTDRERLTWLYDQHFHEIFAYCARRVPAHTAHDVVSDVFVVVWRRIDDVPRDAERAWLFGVARGVLANTWRSESRRGNLVAKLRTLRFPTAVDIDVDLVATTDGVVVRQALARLGAGDQEILRLAAWEELSGPEIAIALDVSLSAVQQRLSRAKKRLANALATGEDTSRGVR
jgi:RNA polymerase sigma-70 factor (ECF subfamily)